MSSFFRIIIRNTLLALVCIPLLAQALLLPRDVDGNIATIEAVYDDVLNITWLVDGNYAQTSGYDADGLMTWDQSQSFINSLNTASYLGVSNWRSPTLTSLSGSGWNTSFTNNGSSDWGYNQTAAGSIYAGSKASEMANLYYNTLGNDAAFNFNGGINPCASNAPDQCLVNTGPFINLQASNYWSNRLDHVWATNGWYFGFDDGTQRWNSKTANYYTIPVVNGDPFNSDMTEYYVLTGQVVAHGDYAGTTSGSFAGDIGATIGMLVSVEFNPVLSSVTNTNSGVLAYEYSGNQYMGRAYFGNGAPLISSINAFEWLVRQDVDLSGQQLFGSALSGTYDIVEMIFKVNNQRIGADETLNKITLIGANDWIVVGEVPDLSQVTHAYANVFDTSSGGTLGDVGSAVVQVEQFVPVNDLAGASGKSVPVPLWAAFVLFFDIVTVVRKTIKRA